MQKRTNIFLTLLISFVIQSETFAQKPNCTGTRVLNQEKSKLESQPEGLTSSVFVIKQDGDEFRQTFNIHFAVILAYGNFVQLIYCIQSLHEKRIKLYGKGN